MCTNPACCSLDPTNARAREGMERVEKPGDADTDTAYDMDCEGIGSSENEVSSPPSNDLFRSHGQ